jgi:hypothetical protein
MDTEKMRLSRGDVAGGSVELFRYYGELDEKFKGNDAESVLVSCFEDDRAGCSGPLDLEPAGGTDAPAVAGLEAGESVLRHGGGEIVAERFGGGEEWGVDDATDGVDTEIVGAGVAAAVAVEAGHRLAATGGQRLAEYVAGGVFDGLFDGHGELSVLSCQFSVAGYSLAGF